MGSNGVGIHSIACYLPETVRGNDWWPEPIVKEWIARNEARLAGPAPDLSGFTEGMLTIWNELQEESRDPFRGCKTRHVAAPGETSSDLEYKASQMAIERAGIDPKDIDLLLENSLLQMDLNPSNGCLLHKRLGLSNRCFTLTTQAACNAFLIHLVIAEQMIKSGQARYALLAHSFLSSIVSPIEENLNATFGDGAAAVIVGPVKEGRGILGHAHCTESQFYDALKVTVPGGNPWDEGKVSFFSDDGRVALAMLLDLHESARTVLTEALTKAGFRPSDVDFYTSHQATTWFAKVTGEAAGINNARTLNTFSEVGNISSANVPLVFERAQNEGLLGEDDLVAVYTGGSGVTYSGMVFRWGV